MPSQTEPRTWPVMDGWRTGTTGEQAGLAHYYLNGYSYCHRWTTTKFDRPPEATDQYCGVCADRWKR